jgi:hypothetical protein
VKYSLTPADKASCFVLGTKLRKCNVKAKTPMFSKIYNILYPAFWADSKSEIFRKGRIGRGCFLKKMPMI